MVRFFCYLIISLSLGLRWFAEENQKFPLRKLNREAIFQELNETIFSSIFVPFGLLLDTFSHIVNLTCFVQFSLPPGAPPPINKTQMRNNGSEIFSNQKFCIFLLVIFFKFNVLILSLVHWLRIWAMVGYFSSFNLRIPPKDKNSIVTRPRIPTPFLFYSHSIICDYQFVSRTALSNSLMLDILALILPFVCSAVNVDSLLNFWSSHLKKIDGTSC